MTAKLKAIDTIGELNAQIEKLCKRRDRLCQSIKDYRGVGQYEGAKYIGTCYESVSVVPNIPKLKRKFGANWRKFVREVPYIALRVEAKVKKPRKRKEEAS